MSDIEEAQPKAKKVKLTDDDTICQRLRVGSQFIERGLAERDKIACRRFLDGSETGAFLLYGGDTFDDVGELPETQETGNVNYLAINILTKVAAIAIAAPDFHVDTGSDDPQLTPDDPGAIPKQEMSEIVRQLVRSLWQHNNWVRVFQKAILKRCLSGMGIVAYLWHDTDGPVFEHVKARDFCVDPCVTDWRKLFYAGRRIRMRREQAIERWPLLEEYIALPASGIVNMDEPSTLTKNSVDVWCYFDEKTEAYAYGEQVLEKGENTYGRVPFIILEGEIAPESELSIGDYDFAAQIQDQLARLLSMMNNQAENGGATGWYNPSLLDDKSKNAFTNGRPQEFVAVNGTGEEVFGYVNAQPSDPMLANIFELQMKALDATTNINEYQRGVINQSVKFATEAALLANQSGARGNQARIQFEQFVNFAARCLLQMIHKFSPSMMTGQDYEPILLQCIENVQDISVIESSTAYKDPNAQQQLMLQLMQALMPFMEAGFVNPTPVIQDLLRAFGKDDTQRYMAQAQPGQPPPTMVPPPEPPPAQPPQPSGPNGPQITYHEAPPATPTPPPNITIHAPGSHMSNSKSTHAPTAAKSGKGH